jgi:NAD(P)-dependent dehydrogenase (short-subunit alcohol dehydrogenase family)
MTLRERHAVILGGTSGIGLETARQMAAAGARVTIVGRSAEKARAAAVETGARAEPGDGGDAAAMAALFARIGPVDHLVLSAGGTAAVGGVDTLETANFRRGFDEKFWVYWTVLKAALPQMARDGSVTVVGAARSRMADPGAIGLAAISGAWDAMVPGLAKGLAPIRVNMIAPGVVDTPIWHGLSEPDRQAVFARYGAERIPVGRVGRAGEVAAMIVAVASNPFVTGVILPVDGGMHL